MCIIVVYVFNWYFEVMIIVIKLWRKVVFKVCWWMWMLIVWVIVFLCFCNGVDVVFEYEGIDSWF